ncbi:hypothetical protein [Streptomyces sp. NPDC003006]
MNDPTLLARTAAEDRNAETPLNFSGRHVEATLVRDAENFVVRGTAIVVNLGVDAVPVAEEPRKGIPPLSSTILRDTVIERADGLVLLRTDDDVPVAPIVDEPGWRLLGDLPAQAAKQGPQRDPQPGEGTPFPRDTPLWRSPQDDAGTIRFDPAYVLKQSRLPDREQEFRIKVNLWFAPAGTDCAIHNRHDFIEVHTQVHGLGSMQKFRAQDHATLYEDLRMSPGYTTPDPFCVREPDGSYRYPWHQYRADTDCVWLAVEYHATAR